MELINLLINPRKGCNMCFLCFKENVDTLDISLKLEIKNKFLDDAVSLADMTKCLFPSLEPMLTQACRSCSDLMIKMYITIHRNKIMTKFIKAIINTINKNITSSVLSSLKTFSVRINISKILDTCGQLYKNPLRNICNSYEDKNNKFENRAPNISVEDDFSVDKQCPHCLKIFGKVKCYKNHIRNHHWKRKKVYHTCDYCEYRTLSKQSLQGHINKNHLRIKPFICNICYKNFYHKKNLVEHQTSHAQLKNEICEICGETFKHKKTLLEHLKLHTGEKSYDCDICGKTFVTSGRRLEHIKRSHGLKNECCLICNKKFSLNKDLTRHMKTVHS